jgi:pimeloyl-ACP methyl ester carboxylesterase
MADVKETAQVFGRNRNLIGIISEPTGSPKAGPAIVVLNAGIIHRVGPSRIGVEIARALATAGYRVLRFDLSGVGDSTASPDVATLADVVRADIADAISLLQGPEREPGVVLFGICSGADNAFYVGSEDERVAGMVLIDPTVHATRGFRLRHAWSKVRSARSWWNVVSGRSLYLRIRRSLSRDEARPPGYYGLLTLDQKSATQRARVMSQRGVRFLYVITGDLQRFCNYPEQIFESLGGAIAQQQLGVEWRPKADHLLRRESDRAWLADRIRAWLEQPVFSRNTRRGAA